MEGLKRIVRKLETYRYEDVLWGFWKRSLEARFPGEGLEAIFRLDRVEWNGEWRRPFLEAFAAPEHPWIEALRVLSRRARRGDLWEAPVPGPSRVAERDLKRRLQVVLEDLRRPVLLDRALGGAGIVIPHLEATLGEARQVEIGGEISSVAELGSGESRIYDRCGVVHSDQFKMTSTMYEFVKRMIDHGDCAELDAGRDFSTQLDVPLPQETREGPLRLMVGLSGTKTQDVVQIDVMGTGDAVLARALYRDPEGLGNMMGVQYLVGEPRATRLNLEYPGWLVGGAVALRLRAWHILGDLDTEIGASYLLAGVVELRAPGQAPRE